MSKTGWKNISVTPPPKNTMLLLFDKLWERPYIGIKDERGRFVTDAHQIIEPIYWSYLNYPDGYERNDTCGGLIMRFF